MVEKEENRAPLEESFINYVRNALDFVVAQDGGQYPVVSDVVVAAGVATRKQLDRLEELGHIKSIEVDVPSILAPGMKVKNKAYYTERLVPSYIKEN